jgi:hypothetical protein
MALASHREPALQAVKKSRCHEGMCACFTGSAKEQLRKRLMASVSYCSFALVSPLCIALACRASYIKGSGSKKTKQKVSEFISSSIFCGLWFSSVRHTTPFKEDDHDTAKGATQSLCWQSLTATVQPPALYSTPFEKLFFMGPDLSGFPHTGHPAKPSVGLRHCRGRVQLPQRYVHPVRLG